MLAHQHPGCHADVFKSDLHGGSLQACPVRVVSKMLRLELLSRPWGLHRFVHSKSLKRLQDVPVVAFPHLGKDAPASLLLSTA